MTPHTVPTSPPPTYDVVPSAAATRAVGWIRISVLLTIANAVLVFFGVTINFIFGMTWSYPIEDLAYGAGNALGALFIGIALALPMLWVAHRAMTQPRLMLAIAAAVYLVGALVAIAVYGLPISMAGQLVIVVLALLGAKNPVAVVPHEAPQAPMGLSAHDAPAPHAAAMAGPVPYPAAPAGLPTAPAAHAAPGPVAVHAAP